MNYLQQKRDCAAGIYLHQGHSWDAGHLVLAARISLSGSEELRGSARHIRQKHNDTSNISRTQHHSIIKSVATAVWSGRAAYKVKKGIETDGEREEYMARMGRWRKDTLEMCSQPLFDGVILVSNFYRQSPSPNRSPNSACCRGVGSLL